MSSIVDLLDWALNLFPRFFRLIGDFVITEGVSVLSLIAAMAIIMLLIYAFIPRP